MFTGDSSEKLRIAPNQVQIDTTHFRSLPSTGHQWKVAVVVFDPQVLASKNAELSVAPIKNHHF